MIGRQAQSRAGPSGGTAPTQYADTNLDDFIPHPVVRKRKNKSGGWGIFSRSLLSAEVPSAMDRPVFGVVLVLLAILATTCLYALSVTVKLGRMHAEMTDPNAPLPPATVQMLERLAEERMSNTLEQAKLHMAHEAEHTVLKLVRESLHDVAAQFDQKPRKELALPAGGQAAQGAPQAQSSVPAEPRLSNDVPYDIRFPDIKQFIADNLIAAVKDVHPSLPYNGPLDLEALITKRAEAMDARWKAHGSKPGDKPGFLVSYWEKNPPWPFQKIRDARGRETGIIALSAPLVDDYYQGELERGLFWRLKNSGHLMIGIASYEHFPQEILNPVDNRHTMHHPDDGNIYTAIEAWLHCMRDPDFFLPPGKPRVLLSESDFTNPMRKDGGGVLIPQGIEKQYDFLYVNQGGAWNDYNRNFTVAKECLKVMAQMGLKVCVLSKDLSVDRELAPYVKSGNLVIHQKELWRDFLKVIESCRAVFTASVADASPRVVAEAMSLNVPVMMNRHIVGGWKYINDKTGVFFTDHHDVRASIQKLRSPSFQAGLSPRQWFMDNWGPYKSSLRLHAFLELVFGRARLEEVKRAREDHRN